MTNKKITNKNLGFSIKKINEDEIEIRHSLLGGSTRGLIRYFLICAVLASVYADVFKYHKPIFSDIYNAVYEDYMWAFNPDVILLPQYKRGILVDYDPGYFQRHPEQYPPMPYEEYRKPHLENHFWRQKKIYFHFIWIPLLLFLVFLPQSRGIRLNRKRRVIYSILSFSPVLDKIDPLTVVVYDRFSQHLFGNDGLFGIGGRPQRFSLGLTLLAPIIKGGARPPQQLMGIYPTPDANHNAHIIKAVRDFFNEENPEFLQYLKPHYRKPTLWGNPLTFFCNAFTLPSFSFSKKMPNRLQQRLKDWEELPDSDKQKFIDEMLDKQQAINTRWKNFGFDNEVNNNDK